MSGISSGIGLVSGINYSTLISSLIAVDQEPANIVQQQISNTNVEEDVFSSLSAELGNIQTVGNAFELPDTFQNADANSSNPSVLTATAAAGAAVGSYQFQVAQLVSTQQSVTNGFASATNSPVGAGTFTIEEGGGEAFSQTPLSQLNGGAGVQSGQFRITDRSGATAVINTSTDVNLDDVVNQINSATGISVKATVTDQGIVLTDTSGKSANDLTVTDLGGGTAAKSLGIAGDAGAGQTSLTGSSINFINSNTPLSILNDGRGIRTAADTSASTGPDFQVNTSDGNNFQVNLGSSQTVGDVIKAINTAGAGSVTATIGTGGQGIVITDNTAGRDPLSVTALNGSLAANDLGILQSGGGSITGAPVLAGLDSVLVSSLKGGQGLPLGTINITNGLGTAATVNLSTATSLSDILSDINNTAGLNVTASINNAGTGIQLTDNSGGGGNLVVSDNSSATAAALGIAGTFMPGTPDVGVNLQRQFVSQTTLLSSLGGGQGVDLGTFTITNSAGATSTVDLTNGTFNTVGDVINAINKDTRGVTASINANGNGILLTDTSGGKGKFSVADVQGTSAENLNLSGSTSTTTIDGGFQKTITVSASDTLSSVQSAINNLGFGVTAQIVNDGSATNPFRLTLTSANSGAAGRVILDGGTTDLDPTTLVQAQDAAVFLGGTGTSQPLLVTSNTNQLTNVVRGVSISLVGASTTPVTLNVTLDPSNVASGLANFVQQFNILTQQIGTLTSFNSSTNQSGILLGNSTADQIQNVLFSVVNSSIKNAGPYQSLADLGISIGADAQLTFDTNTFDAAFEANPTAVQNLFTQTVTTINPKNSIATTTQTGLGSIITNAITGLTDPLTGVITLENNTLATKASNYQTYFNELNTLVQDQKTQLTTTFANLEVTLAGLQSQQQALSSFTGITEAAATNSAANNTSSSSSSSSG